MLINLPNRVIWNLEPKYTDDYLVRYDPTVLRAFNVIYNHPTRAERRLSLICTSQDNIGCTWYRDDNHMIVAYKKVGSWIKRTNPSFANIEAPDIVLSYADSEGVRIKHFKAYDIVYLDNCHRIEYRPTDPKDRSNVQLTICIHNN